MALKVDLTKVWLQIERYAWYETRMKLAELAVCIEIKGWIVVIECIGWIVVIEWGLDFESYKIFI